MSYTGGLFQIMAVALLAATAGSITPDNVCTFHHGDHLFSLLYLVRENAYSLPLKEGGSISFNFCSAFTPPQCASQNINTAYSFIVYEPGVQAKPSNASIDVQDDQDQKPLPLDLSNETDSPQEEEKSAINLAIDPDSEFKCARYSSNSYSYLFQAEYIKKDKLGTLHLTLWTEKEKQLAQNGARRYTDIWIECSDEEGFDIEDYEYSDEKITIKGSSAYGCPVFSVSSLWKVFEDNIILFGFILFVLGVYLLFYGRVTLEMTVFVATFFISMAVVGSIFTLFVSPYSSTVRMYFFFLLLLIICTLIGYGAIRLINVSILFVGAILGFIIGMLVNSIFCSITSIYSVWSLVFFEIIFTIPFALLTFKYRNEVIIASSSLLGSYLVVRPISWIFGGFPNEFLLYHSIETNQMDKIPWSFFGYLIIIIALAIVGAMYQLLKLQRENPDEQIEVNGLQQMLEEPADRIKMSVDKLIEKFKSDDGDSTKEYKKMKEMKESPSSYPQFKEEF